MKIFWTLLILLAAGCSGSPIRVDSFPEGADVFIVSPGLAPRKVGQTPMSVEEASLNAPRGSYQLQISKEGFFNEHILVPPGSLSRATQISVKLKEAQAAKGCAQVEAELPQIAKGTAEVQQFIASKKLDQAEMSLRVLVSKYPSISIFHVLLGNVYFLRRDLENALSSYRRAQDLGGANQEAGRMIRKIEDIRGPSAFGSSEVKQ